MRTQLMRVAVAFALAGCHGPETVCGPGTTLSGGACVADSDVTSCGDGTSLVDGVCLGPAPQEDAADVQPGTDAVADVPDAVDVAGDASAVQGGCQPACASGFTCFQGVCVPEGPPAGWHCDPAAWSDGTTCNCGCGIVDPDCAKASAPVTGCPGATTCNADGTCPPCKPDCAGKACGTDGCGGVCGECLDPTQPVCIAGKCSACIPKCTGLQCGDDGCGGSCGTCPNDKLCAAGTCVGPSAESSCLGNCGGVAPSGCACTAGCAAKGNCCLDVDVCGCIPACDGKACGNDGCGGTCGTCGNGEVCSAGQCVFPNCSPLTCHGHGVCNAATITCTCDPGFFGPYCDQCPPGMVGFPNCTTPCADDSGCDDANPCTDDICTPAKGCQNPPNTAPCSDGDICTNTACFGGKCATLSILNCDDANACTTDYCDSASGCAHLPSGVTACEDDKPCLSGDLCNGATCVGGTTPTNCDDGNTCTDDSCDAATGCIHAGNGGGCSLVDACSAGAVCDGTACKSLGAKNCDDGDPCTNDACDAATGACVSSPAAAGTPCDDGQACSKNDVCDGAGKCASGAVVCKLPAVSGLVAHYATASLSNLVYGADKGVATWVDETGNGHDLSAVDAGNPPKITDAAVNGSRGVRFGGSAGMVSAPLALGTAGSIFAVVCGDAKSDFGTLASQGSAGWRLAATGTPTTLSLTVAGSVLDSAQTVGGGVCTVIAARFASGSRSLDVITDLTHATDAGGIGVAATSAALFLGTDSTGAAGGPIVAEFLLFDHAVSDDERDAVTSYLRAAWGFTPPTPDFAWYDATDLATVITASGDSGLVTTWADKSGLGRDASVGTATSPQFFANGTPNGQPAIRFAGSQDRLCTASAPSSPNLTIFAAFELDQAQASATLLSQGQDPLFALHVSPAAPSAVNWQVGTSQSGGVPFTSGTWQVLTAVQDAATVLLYLDADAGVSTPQPAIPAGNGPICLGNSLAGATPAGGFLSEVRAYASALSATDRRFIEDSLRAKFGL